MGNENSKTSSEDVSSKTNIHGSHFNVNSGHSHGGHKKKKEIKVINTEEVNQNNLKMENRPMPPIDELVQMFELLMVNA